MVLGFANHAFVLRHDHPWLRKPAKITGRGKVRYVERKLLVPIDAILNKRRYPPGQFGNVRLMEFQIVS